MDPVEARLSCLKLARKHHTHEFGDPPTAAAILATAEAWSKFVLGPLPRESSGKGDKGRDAETPVTHVP